MKYFILAGESSGDIHGANLMEALKNQDTSAEFVYWGGDAMKAVHGNPLKHIRELAFMGFWEVLINIRTILNLLNQCKKDISENEPDILILIDYPGFNLRMAKWAHLKGIKVVYYIVPQVWAWHKSRVFQLKKYTDLLIAILPFEEEFYKNNECNVFYVGHPLLDEIKKFSLQQTNEKNLKTIDLALLPGSRHQEVKHMLPVYLKAADQLKISCVIAASNNLPLTFYEKIVKMANLQNIQVEIRQNKTYEILRSSKHAFVTSGTATLETALFKVPQVIGYKGNTISYIIAKKLITLKYISLVNLILDKMLVKELIQSELNISNLIQSYHDLVKREKQILHGYEELIHLLGDEGASFRAATLISKVAQSGKM
ncbi:MAG: lipid-A-disaccharide synthase [Saprospiraceae bacterium]|nr:lipid-A-disaccharide synthase [Saprospiraceae bacterium]